jgi:hypothetical protein
MLGLQARMDSGSGIKNQQVPYPLRRPFDDLLKRGSNASLSMNIKMGCTEVNDDCINDCAVASHPFKEIQDVLLNCPGVG